MKLTETLREAIKTKNVARIHSVFYTIAHEDPSFESGKYVKTMKYVQELGIDGFIEQHDGIEFAPMKEWNVEYWADVASELQDNFSQERINHLIEVGRFVYGKKAKVLTKQTAKVMETKKVKKFAGKEKSTVMTSSGNRNKLLSKEDNKRSRVQKTCSNESGLWLTVFGIVAVGLLVNLFKGKK